MASITVRDVPDDVRDELAARAARSGRSLQEHLRTELIKLAEKPDLQSVLDRIEERKTATGTTISVEHILDDLDDGRR